MTPSRRYPLIIVGLLVVIGALAVLLAWSLVRNQPAATDPPPLPAASATPTYNESAGDASPDGANSHDPNEAAWRPVVENFGRSFTDVDGGAKKWRTRLIGDPQHPYVTDAVADQLKTVDITNVPKGRYDSYEALKTSKYEVAVKVTYREGWALVLYLNTDGTNWQVHAYDKWEQ